ncbi:hypothetical protein [Pseudohaliea rubra]|nr:hypothetical protein [Pseudohaliea rubra]
MLALCAIDDGIVSPMEVAGQFNLRSKEHQQHGGWQSPEGAKGLAKLVHQGVKLKRLE